MQLFKHAYFSLKYSKLQWLIKGLILFLYLNLVFSLIDSVNGFRKKIEESQANYAAQIHLFPASGEVDLLTYQQLEEYGKSEYVDSIEHTGFLYLEPEEEQPTDSLQENELSSAVSILGVLPQNELKNKVKMVEGIDSFELGAGECLISQRYAEMEQLSVGDTLSYSMNQKQIDFTVRGIYETAEAEAFASDIYTTVEAVEALDTALYKQIDWYSVFHLVDPTAIENFSSELKEKGLSEHYQIFSNEAYYKEETVFLNEAKKRASYALFGVILLGIVPIYGVTNLFKKRQASEIGFLYSTGISKAKLVWMYSGNNLLLLLTMSLLASFSARSYVASFAQFILDTTQQILDSQTADFFSTSSFSIVTSVVEPITAISVESSLYFEKFLLAAIVLIALSVGIINDIRRFQLGSRLMEEI
ncbi:ABC transporter permease [uncultured Enterococcus sp.]|uniref:ABC transporter permease n=1 Tax=uncultured Enterococcus sp. TaxID=167972 RepID=UPI002AA7DF2B|nr:ABC transporter permease [uncultured Enterococcus sp.]